MAQSLDLRRQLSIPSAIVLTTALAAIPWFLWRRLKSVKDDDASDPGLFKKHSQYESFTTPSGFVYPKIRTFFKEHQNREKLPKDIPLLVFTHGLGGNATQFLPLLNILINNASCLAIDFPGCGRSDFKPDDVDAFTTQALANLLGSAIDRFRDHENDQKVVLIGHSMGCSINALLASSTSPLSQDLKDVVIGMIAISPRSGIITPKQERMMRRMTFLPPPLFAVLRWIDRRGGLRSHSVTRVVGEDADDDTRKRQQTYNLQSRSEVFLRMLAGSLGPQGMPVREIWSGVKVPLHLVAGESDTLSPADEAERIADWLRPASAETRSQSSPLDSDPSLTPAISEGNEGEVLKEEHVSSKHAFALKITIFSAPASHALLYTTTTLRALAGFIETFLESHVDVRLGAAWQLQHLTTSGKWDVKNLTKWQSVAPCSDPIAGIFRAMKTMREVDDEHCPREFVKKFSSNVLPDGVCMVIDISHETPVYDPKGLEEGGVEYHKFPTVSKQAPQEEEVEHFIKLIDEMRERIRTGEVSNFSGKDSSPGVSPTIGVHCHYGFNRTGFFIVCYLVERCGYRLEDAIDEFAKKRPRGIKHEHFKNELFVRYAVHMRSGGRRGTIIG